jgi:pyridoxal phosphate phosphatase PHOSPHO2
VVSDANTFFIETVLAHHGVLGCFSDISTNPARVDADGRLRISPFHDSASAPHGCSLCPENMCKVWIVVGRWITSGIQWLLYNPSLTARGQWLVQTK